MEFQVFDISKNALAQGFAVASYDLILVPNVAHATPCVKETHKNLKPLLKPDDMLLLTEISTATSKGPRSRLYWQLPVLSSAEGIEILKGRHVRLVYHIFADLAVQDKTIATEQASHSSDLDQA